MRNVTKVSVTKMSGDSIIIFFNSRKTLLAIAEKRIRVLLNLNNEKFLYAICASSQLNILQTNAFLRKNLIPGQYLSSFKYHIFMCTVKFCFFNFQDLISCTGPYKEYKLLIIAYYIKLLHINLLYMKLLYKLLYSSYII